MRKGSPPQKKSMVAISSFNILYINIPTRRKKLSFKRLPLQKKKDTQIQLSSLSGNGKSMRIFSLVCVKLFNKLSRGQSAKLSLISQHNTPPLRGQISYTHRPKIIISFLTTIRLLTQLGKTTQYSI